MPNISIVIPVYNVAEYLRQCLDSIGLMDRDDVEIILVNDGSTDESPAICREYADKHSNVKVLDKPNGGLSDARNVGTEAAQGRFIYYLDSDDWVAPGAVMKLYDYAIENDCDVVQGNIYYAYEKSLLYLDHWPGIPEDRTDHVLNREQAMKALVRNIYVKNFAWGKLYKASIVKKFKFPVGKYFEDSYWQHLVINEVNRYGVLKECLHYYRQRPSSISSQASFRSLDLIEGNRQRLDFIRKNYPQLTGWMQLQHYKAIWVMSDYAKLTKDPKVIEIFDNVRAELHKDKSTPFLMKLASKYSLCSKLFTLLLSANAYHERSWNKVIRL